MIVESKQKREFWLSAAFNSVPDLVIAGVAGLVFDNGFLVFVGVYFGLQLIYIAMWLKNTAWFWIRYVVRDKKILVRMLLDFLTENKFPRPGDHVIDAESYLGEVADDDTVDVRTRLLAAGELGAFDYVKNSMRLQEGMRISMCYDAAIEQYHRNLSEA